MINNQLFQSELNVNADAIIKTKSAYTSISVCTYPGLLSDKPITKQEYII